MQITAEGKLGLCLGLIALAGGGAMMVAPDKLWIGWTLIGLAGLGGIGLGFHHFGRKFAAVFLVAGVLWFDYWYYSRVLNSTDTPQVNLPAKQPAQPQVPRTQILSRLDKFIFACDVPPPDSEIAARFPQAKEEMRQRYLVWGDIVGMAITVTDIRGGYRIDAQATTEEAKRRLFVAGSAGATKLSISMRRIEKQIIVDVTADLPPIYGLMNPEPSGEDTMAIQKKIENLVGADGKCHLL
jgi:hypothetical protein